MRVTTFLANFVQNIPRFCQKLSNASSLSAVGENLPFREKPVVFLTAFTTVSACIALIYSVYMAICLLHWIIGKLSRRDRERIVIGDDQPGNADTSDRVFVCGQWAEPECERPAKRRYTEGLRWLKQADVDHRSAANDISRESPAYEWVCFKCQEAAVKSIKAVLYVKTEEDYQDFGCDLMECAAKTNDDLVEACAQALQERCGPVARMHFLDRLPFPRIASDMFSEKDANLAFRTCGELLTHVREHYFNRPA